MGELYYLHVNPCQHCGRADHEYLICKSLRMFRGYERHEDAPGGNTLLSWQEWKQELQLSGRVVIDEYGVQIPTQVFIDSVESIPVELRRKHFNAVTKQNKERGYQLYIGRDWLDDDQYSFYSEEFS